MTTRPGLTDGALHAALANELGRIVADFSGRGPMRSRAFVDHDVVVCLLQDGATVAERRLTSGGRAELVRSRRDVLNRIMEPELVACVERLTGRAVISFFAGSDTPGASSVEVFVLAPMDGGGTGRRGLTGGPDG